MPDIGIIIIGRNEGERLRRCLASVIALEMPVAYVDSASDDGSTALARSMGAEVIDLDMSRPFAAARARNEGFARLMQITPQLRYVQFIDGDCEMVPGWFDIARQTLESRAEVAVVCGRVRERFPEHSIFNRLADVEWNTPIGETKSCGGIAMMRISAFQQVKGFDPTVVAGEEPELCQRLRGAGWKIVRLDAEMTLHDSAMLHFRQWWKRSIRSGYGAMDVWTRFGNQGLFRKHVTSARRWTRIWPVIVLICALGVAINSVIPGPSMTAFRWRMMISTAIMLAAVGGLPLQMLRVAYRNRRRAGDGKTALAYGILTMIAMWANMKGQRQYIRDRAAGRNARMIEYKTVAAVANPNVPVDETPSRGATVVPR